MTAEGAGLDARRRGHLAERMVHTALKLAGTVRQEDSEAIGKFLASIPAEERDALLIVCAAMIPEDRTPQELLAHVTWDEEGRPIPPGAEMVLWSPRQKPLKAPRRKPPRRPDRELAPCGTVQAWRRHHARHELVDPACRAAKAADSAAQRAARKQQEKAA